MDDQLEQMWSGSLASLQGIRGDLLFVIGALITVFLLYLAYTVIIDFIHRVSRGYTDDDLYKYEDKKGMRDHAESRAVRSSIRSKFDGSRYEGQL